MVFEKIAKELDNDYILKSIKSDLKSIIRSIKSKKSLYLKTNEDYKSIINNLIKIKDFNSKEDLNYVIKELFKFFNNKNIKPTQKDVDLTNKCKAKLKEL
jgi:hypothetical protein